jgi:hypothetical protein
VLLHLLLNIVVALSMKQKLASSLCDGTWLAQAASAAKVLEVISMARDTLHSRWQPPTHLLWTHLTTQQSRALCRPRVLQHQTRL